MTQPMTIFRFFPHSYQNQIKLECQVTGKAAYYLQAALLETLDYEYDFQISNQ